MAAPVGQGQASGEVQVGESTWVLQIVGPAGSLE